MVLTLNETTLPSEGLFVVRHQRHGALLRGGYAQLMDQGDAVGLVWLERFLQAMEQSAVMDCVLDERVRSYYDGLIAHYFAKCDGGVLRW